MRGLFTPRSEIVAGLDQAGAEELLPESIDRDAGGQRIVRRYEPVGKIQTRQAAYLVATWRSAAEPPGLPVRLSRQACRTARVSSRTIRAADRNRDRRRSRSRTPRRRFEPLAPLPRPGGLPSIRRERDAQPLAR